jgi:hypothetical protein
MRWKRARLYYQVEVAEGEVEAVGQNNYPTRENRTPNARLDQFESEDYCGHRHTD